MSDAETLRLYSTRILALAAGIPHLGRLPAPGGSAKRRSPLCGSSVTADVVLQDGRIAALGWEVQACALGQAAAGVAGPALIGRSRAEVEAARDQLAAMLAGGPVPRPPFDGFEALTPARGFANRHASIQLALQAVAEAMAVAEAGTPTGTA